MRRFGPNKFRLLGAVALLGTLVVQHASAQQSDVPAEAFLRNSHQATQQSSREKPQNRSRLNLFDVRQNSTSNAPESLDGQASAPAPRAEATAPPRSAPPRSVQSNMTLTGPTEVHHGVATPLDYPDSNLDLASPIDLTGDASSRRVMQQTAQNPWGSEKPANQSSTTRIVQLPEPPRGRLVQKENAQVVREVERLSLSAESSQPSKVTSQSEELETAASDQMPLESTNREEKSKSLAPMQSQRLTRNITVVNVSVTDIGNGSVPDDQSVGLFGANVAMPTGWDRAMVYQRVHWQPSLICHYPLYFEDAMLERHGHVRWGCLQPAASGAKFFATIPMLPYLYTLERPWECQYAVGHYRAGSCAPTLRDSIPYDRNAMVVEALSCAGFFWAMPL